MSEVRGEEIAMMELRPWERLQEALPPLATYEFEALKASIAEHGVLQRILVLPDGRIIDGYHRWKIAPDAPYDIITLDDETAFLLGLALNAARRQMSLEQTKKLRKGQRKIALELRKNGKMSQEKAAGILGVPESTIRWWEAEAKKDISIVGANNANNPPDLRTKIPPKQWPIILERVESGETQEQIAADYHVTQGRVSHLIKKERKQNEAAESRAQSAVHLEDSGIHIGDFRAAGNIVQDASVDLIFTDPPYADALIYTDLAQFAERVLRPGGWCLAYCGIAHLPEVLPGMSNHLTYGWVFAVQHTGGDLRFRKFRLQNKWKPVVGFFKPPLSVWWEWFADLTSGGKEKKEHSWQQAMEEAKHFIRALSPKGGLICDPFAGSGTTCLAAKKLDCQWIAFEQNEDTALKARQRLND